VSRPLEKDRRTGQVCSRPGCPRRVPWGRDLYCSDRCAHLVAGMKYRARTKERTTMSGIQTILETAPTVHALHLVEETGRVCGPCRQCCVNPHRPGKPLGQPCPALRAEGCAIYEGRPQDCRAYQCLWLQGGLPAAYRPDLIGGLTVHLRLWDRQPAAVLMAPRPALYDLDEGKEILARVEQQVGLVCIVLDGQRMLWRGLPERVEEASLVASVGGGQPRPNHRLLVLPVRSAG